MTLDQFDFFADTPSTQIEVDTPSTPVAPAVTTPPQYNPKGLMAFALKEAHRIWSGEQHRVRSLAQLSRFLQYNDNDQLDITDIGPDPIHDFLDALAEEGASTSTQNRYAATISKVLKIAVKRRLIAEAPSVHFHQEDPMARPRYFTPDEVATIIKFFVDRGDQWMADMVEVGCKTGLRRMEIVNLAKGNIPLSSCGRFAVVVPKYTKNKLERSVPIDSCKEAVLRLMESIPEIWSHRTFYRRWSLLKRDMAPADPHFVFHCCRHTAATVMTNDVGLPTILVQKWLGHKDPKTTLKYVSTSDDAMIGASDALASRFNIPATRG